MSLGGPEALFPLLVAAAGLCLVGILGIVVAFFATTNPGERRARGNERREAEPALEQGPEPAPRATPPEQKARAPATELARAELAPDDEPPRVDEAPGEWPPPRAFTARCKAPGGGCVETCTTLAGGRCLDPCFIHTSECSKDCQKPDGTCGWPPPDNP